MMNGAVLRIGDVDALQGELYRCLLALGIVLAVLVVAWAIQEWRAL